jgi:hypothetical protein
MHVVWCTGHQPGRGSRHARAEVLQEAESGPGGGPAGRCTTGGHPPSVNDNGAMVSDWKHSSLAHILPAAIALEAVQEAPPDTGVANSVWTTPSPAPWHVDALANTVAGSPQAPLGVPQEQVGQVVEPIGPA